MPDFDGGNVTVAISAHNVPGEDSLLIDPSGSVALSAGVTVGSVVSVGGTDIGTITSDGQNGADLVVALNANSTGPLVQTLVRALHYSNTDTVSPDVTPRTVTVTIDDGDGGVTPGADVTVNVAAVNDLPGTTGAASISAAPGVPSVVGASAFNFTDGDPGDSLGAVRFDTVPNAATGQFFVDVNGDGVVDAGEAVAANDVVSIAAINAGQLKWLSPTGVSGTGTFTFTVQDTGGPAFAAASQIGTVTVAGSDAVDDLASTGATDQTNGGTTDGNGTGDPGAGNDGLTILNGVIPFGDGLTTRNTLGPASGDNTGSTTTPGPDQFNAINPGAGPARDQVLADIRTLVTDGASNSDLAALLRKIGSVFNRLATDDLTKLVDTDTLQALRDAMKSGTDLGLIRQLLSRVADTACQGAPGACDALRAIISTAELPSLSPRTFELAALSVGRGAVAGLDTASPAALALPSFDLQIRVAHDELSPSMPDGALAYLAGH